MGAIYNETILTADSDTEAISAGVEVIQQCCIDYGLAGYSGTFAECDGVEVRADLTDDLNTVKDLVCDRVANKWGPAILVPLTDRGGYYMGAWCSS